MATPSQTNSSASIGETFLGIIVLGVLCGVVWLALPEKTQENVKYSFFYQINSDKVVRDKKPTDCDFDRVPYGNKGCYYKKVVTLQRNDKDKVTGVYMSWERVQD